ncbi:MAG TPA: hypothetical protein PLW68_06310 [Casimicrobiaceae bacterium]|nr:hypothetical protein [Casimicrobiaceae bacterium]
MLLFAQGAVAAYACPSLTAKGVPYSASQPVPMQVDCNHMGKAAAMDVNTPNLCLAHCQNGQQISDPSESPTMPPIIASILVVALADPAALGTAGRTYVYERITAAASPPHTVLHCCFRI